ncbi:MAG TPA: DUF4019 domain-containing protein [Pyrinomonadaceae bacterium]|nr:DUF4019 domain-containing protein [Pyrinomonadaceae bacterium]
MSRRIALLALLVAISLGCGVSNQRPRVPAEVEDVVTNITTNIDQQRYEQIYNESSELWKRDVTREQSNEVFKTLRDKLGKIENRSLHAANEQQNSGGLLKGHAFILSYETRFERGRGMETFTLIEENGQWRLARYLVNSTNLQ